MSYSELMRILLAFTSLSGNTQELARQIAAQCQQAGHHVDHLQIDTQSIDDFYTSQSSPRLASYALYLLGTWTDNAGRTPQVMKAFIADFVNLVGKPKNLAVFGTGETQWGEDYYCRAVHRIADFFASTYPRLLIEQMPYSAEDARNIAHWTHDVLTRIKHRSAV